MAEIHAEVRRFNPETGDRRPTGEDFKVELEPERSVLDGILQVKDDEDGSLAIRCSCQAAICGSCGVKINGKSSLACNTKLGSAAELVAGSRRQDRRRADGQHARDQGPDRGHGRGPLEEDPARGPVAAARGRPAGARVHRRRRVDDRHHPVDGLHPVRRLRVGLPLARGRPGVRRPRRAREGVPLRRRPARRAHRGPPARPRRGPARHLRLHPLLRLRRGLPQGRRADEPDHAAAPPAPPATTTSRTSTTATATRRRSST